MLCYMTIETVPFRYWPMWRSEDNFQELVVGLKFGPPAHSRKFSLLGRLTFRPSALFLLGNDLKTFSSNFTICITVLRCWKSVSRGKWLSVLFRFIFLSYCTEGFSELRICMHLWSWCVHSPEWRDRPVHGWFYNPDFPLCVDHLFM